MPFTARACLSHRRIAMMAKTFDREWESQKSTFLYQKARQTQTWIEYPPMPPPFNLVPIAFYTVVAPLRLAKRLGGACTKCARYLSDNLEPQTIKTGNPKLPLEWKATHDAAWLGEFVCAFTRDSDAQQAKEIVEDLSSKNKEMIHDLGQFLIRDRVSRGKEQEARVLGALESQSQQIAEQSKQAAEQSKQIAELVKAVQALQAEKHFLGPRR